MNRTAHVGLTASDPVGAARPAPGNKQPAQRQAGRAGSRLADGRYWVEALGAGLAGGTSGNGSRLEPASSWPPQPIVPV